MNWGKTLLLLLGLIVLSGYLYIFEIRGGAEKKLADERKKQAEWRNIQLFPYQPDEFKKVTLFKDGTTIVYQKEDGVWWMKEPLTIRGGEGAINDIILSIINVVETDPAGDNPTDLAQFGLDAPPLSISVVREGDAQPKTLLIGVDNPTSITLYAKWEHEPRVFLVGSLIRWEMNKEFYNLTNRTGPFFPDAEKGEPASN
jgi:hypothetical protein